MNTEIAVKELVKNGYAYVPVNSVLVTDTMDAFARFMNTLCGEEISNWSLTRLGEKAPDLGVITKTQMQGFDEKTYFHLAHDLPVALELQGITETSKQLACLQVMQTLHDTLKSISLEIALEMSRIGVVDSDFCTKVSDTYKLSQPYNTSVLRLLHYPDVPHQTGARAHYDKGWLSMHLGDVGGELWVRTREGVWIEVSPPRGMALLFFGVKMLELTRGEVTPIRHKATTEKDSTRQAAVMFVHADIGRDVINAEDEIKRFNL